jgi:hypothetical protein
MRDLIMGLYKDDNGNLCFLGHGISELNDKKFLKNNPYHRDNYAACTFFLIGIAGVGFQIGPLGTAATNRPIVPAPGDYDDGKIGGVIGRGN